MVEKALGLIETMGLVPAIEAADTSLKTAQVSLDGLELVGAGIVTISIRGDVSSVKASVEAGRDAAARLGQVLSTTVIARTAEGLECVSGSDGERFEPESAFCEQGERSIPTLAKLEEMSVVQLRSIARELDGCVMSRGAIRSARKKDLIENIVKYYQERGVFHG